MVEKIDIKGALAPVLPNVYLSAVDIDYDDASGTAVMATPTFVLQENKPDNIFTKWIEGGEDEIKYLKVVLIQTQTDADREFVSAEAEHIVASLSKGKGYDLSEAPSAQAKMFDLTQATFLPTNKAANEVVYEASVRDDFKFNTTLKEPNLTYFIGFYFDIVQIFIDNDRPYNEGFGGDGTWVGVFDALSGQRSVNLHTIRDFRLLKDAQAAAEDSIRSKQIFERNEKKTYVPEEGRDFSYFSDAWASSDIDDKAKIIFAINHLKMVQDRSQLGSFAIGSQMRLQYFPISALKLSRERVRTAGAANRLSAQRSPAEMRFEVAEDVLCVANDVNGKLKEAHTDSCAVGEEMLANFDEGFRSFRFVDREISKISSGYYQYKVGVELTDGSKKMINDLSTALAKVLQEVQEQLSQMVSHGWFDEVRQRIAPEFRELLDPLLKTIEDGLSRHVIPTIEMLTGEDQKDLLTSMLVLLSSAHGSVQGYSQVAEFLLSFISRLTTLLPDSASGTNIGDDAPKITKANKVPSIAINVTLPYIHDANDIKGFGASVFEMQGDDFSKIAVGKFMDRIDHEKGKYPVEGDAGFAYFTPLKIKIGDHGEEPVSKFDHTTVSLDKNRITKMKIQQAKVSKGKLSPHPTDSTEKDWISNTLIDGVLSAGIIHVTKEVKVSKLANKPKEALHAPTDALKPDDFTGGGMPLVGKTQINDNVLYELTQKAQKSKGKKHLKNESTNGSSDGKFFNASEKYNINHLAKEFPEKLAQRLPPSVQAGLKAAGSKSEYLASAIPGQVKSTMASAPQLNADNVDPKVVAEAPLDLINLSYVEMLDMFESGDIKMPIWKMLNDPSTLPQGTNYLCRSRPLTLLPSAEEEGHMPIFNQYFVLSA